MMGGLRVIFMGSAQLSCPSLRALLDCSSCEVVGVVTQPDRPKGRDLKVQPTPVKEMALQKSVPVLQPERARNPEFQEALVKLQPGLIAVAAYGQILPRALLELPKFGCLNVHTSLLPKYRGAAPIQNAILNDEPETGVTIMKMDEGLDTGGILAQESTQIEPQDTAQTVHDRLAEMGARLLVQTLPAYLSGALVSVPQPAEGASYAPKIKKQDGIIDWSRPARSIWNQVRGLVPWPCAFTFVRSGSRSHLLKLWRAEPAEGAGSPGEILRAGKDGILVGTGQGTLRIAALQLEGGRRLTAQEFVAGHALKPGERLG